MIKTEKKQTQPLTEDEIRSVYRNEFYTIDVGRYFNHSCTGMIYGKKKNINNPKIVKYGNPYDYEDEDND